MRHYSAVWHDPQIGVCYRQRAIDHPAHALLVAREYGAKLQELPQARALLEQCYRITAMHVCDDGVGYDEVWLDMRDQLRWSADVTRAPDYALVFCAEIAAPLRTAIDQQPEVAMLVRGVARWLREEAIRERKKEEGEEKEEGDNELAQ